MDREGNKKTYLHFFGLAGLILWTMLMPGYILTLDMVWTPDLPAYRSPDGFDNSLPVRMLIHAIALVIPSWIVQKIMLVSLFFLLFFIPWRFLPYIKRNAARIFAASVYALNPFVYSRMLAGQWTLLFGYALMPFLLHAVLDLVRNPRLRSSLVFALALTLIGLFSIHFLYLGIIVSFAFIAVRFFTLFFNTTPAQPRNTVWKHLILWPLIGFGLFIAASSFWIVPALGRTAPIESRFDTAHFEAFSAAPNGRTPVMLNVAALGGFWAEDDGWGRYFAWPQSNPLFWTAWAGLGILIAFGIREAYKGHIMSRRDALCLITLGIFAYGAALGAAETPFRAFNLFLYEHVPLWPGLRDSHKIAGILALLYALFAGLGAEKFFNRFSPADVSSRPDVGKPVLAHFLFLLPLFFGLYMWGGFQKQLTPVWYPESWTEAAALLDAEQNAGKALVLPWEGYLSLEFAHQLLVSNPAPAFFGKDRVVAGKSIEISNLEDQEIDPEYREIDAMIRGIDSYSDNDLRTILKKHGIDWILFILNRAGENEEKNFRESSSGSVYDRLYSVSGEIIINDRSLILKKI